MELPWAVFSNKRSWVLTGAFLVAASCGDDVTSSADPSACIGGEHCVGELVCVDGLCVEPGDDETATGAGDGDAGDGDGDCAPGNEGCACELDETCDPGLSCVDGLCVGSESCGDGVVDPGEECDDQNDVDTDACLSNCVLASCGDGFVGPGEGCDDGNDIDDDDCDNACALTSCGDGVVQDPEECDDQDADDTDDCLSTCMSASCGDGFVWTGNEACDDGNLLNGDGCLNSCEEASCGDGVVYQGVEACDDGNDDDTDACVAGCVVASCGDGHVHAGVEDCDDQNNDNTDTCVVGCIAAACGDGFVGPGEGCDDGNNINNDACTNACSLASCGDAVTQPGEECDDGNNNNNDACLNTCVNAECSDGFVWAGNEACDDGNVNNTDACLDTCEIASCGDSYVWAGQEACDDGNVNNTDACLNSCVVASCGDNFVWAGQEACDDGNANNTDACLNSCVVASCGDGFVWAGQEECDDNNNLDTDACVGACELAECGDGFLWAGQEECDDDNLQGHDGCETSCELTTITQLKSGLRHTCALFGDGAVRCWGHNSSGELGLGHANNIGDNGGEMPPALVNLGGPAVKLGMSQSTTCALLETGEVTCWGDGASGALGHESTVDVGVGPGQMPPPIIDVGPGTVVDLEGGVGQMYALFEDGSMRGWGTSGFGELGYGNTLALGKSPGTMPPPTIDTGGPVAKMSAGMNHICVLMQSGAVRCWGRYGGSGYGNSEDLGDEPGEMPPGNVAVGPGVVTDISAGEDNTCVIVAGEVRCWGNNNNGKNGQGNTVFLGRNPGELPPPNTDFGAGVPLQILAGRCTRLLLTDGNVRAWGLGFNGCHGYGSQTHLGDGPGEMPTGNLPLGGGFVIQLAADERSLHTCALFDDYSVRCWGYGASGELGKGNTQTVGDQPGEMPPVLTPVF